VMTGFDDAMRLYPWHNLYISPGSHNKWELLHIGGPLESIFYRSLHVLIMYYT
jgi:hypothetical protein